MKLPCSTTPEIPGRKIKTGKGIVCGEAIRRNARLLNHHHIIEEAGVGATR